MGHPLSFSVYNNLLKCDSSIASSYAIFPYKDPGLVGGEEVREDTDISDVGGKATMAATPSSKPPPGKHLAVIWI